MAEYVAPTATDIGTVLAAMGGNQRIQVWDPPLPAGRYGIGHYVMIASQVTELITLLQAALACGGDRDAYLTRLDEMIRKTHGQTWNDQASQYAMLGGLVAARNLYAHPGEARTYRTGLAEALEACRAD